MRYRGQVFDRIRGDSDDFAYQVTITIVTPADIKIDWKEDGERGHLKVASTDGITYIGSYG